MARYAIPEPKIKTLPIVGKDEVFPVRRVYCIGRNYAAHAVEMGHDPDKEDPFFFQKNPDNLNLTGRFPYPPKSSDVHHERQFYCSAYHVNHSFGRPIYQYFTYMNKIGCKMQTKCQ